MSGVKTVIIVGSASSYEGEEKEIWGVNRAYLHQKNLTRLYFMDRIDRKSDDFIEEVNALGIPVVCQEQYPDVPLSRAFQLEERIKHLGVRYFTSSIAYMLADAIAEDYKRIVLHRILCFPDSIEYLPQKSCLDGWCMYAVAKGIQVVIDKKSLLMNPYPWEGQFYGYCEPDYAEGAQCQITMAARVARKYRLSAGMPDEPFAIEVI